MKNLLGFVRQKKPPAACLIAGEEIQLIEEARAAVRQHFNSDACYSVDLDKIQPDDLMLGQNKGLFSTSPELYELVSNAKPSTAAIQLINDLCDSVRAPDCLLVVILEWDYKYKKAAWLKKLGEKLQPVICERLSPAQAAEWIRYWTDAAGLTLTEDSCRFLSEQTEGNLFAAKQAVAKLGLTTAANNNSGSAAVDINHIREILTDGARYDVFDLSDAIYSGDGARALAVLRQLRAAGVADVLIHWTLATIISNLAAIADNRRAPVWGKQLTALKQMTKNINPNILHRLTRQAAYADRVIKGVAGGDSESILCALAARLATYQRGVKITLPHYQA